ncbi:TetR/AcrR family transcriptional regulator [Streptomyces lavendofoliae]|uniref:TetR family transcriptional regulator n=1 Tax=Streptomyces lavendofoliae TaxID=67314 RepID=A0A918M6R7_9ACTN|nr:TetR/AcrR family transcriptional regulator [Streptomyces lavendofoliae]GGU53299.1 TetR family transcriptional regulator [Streptomyces lavendofoliae]
MPTTREALLNAALAALRGLPWSAVRMVDVASAAGVSRQTLYNEFGSKEGLARALVRREADAYLRGVERALGAGPDAATRLVSVAEWTVGEAAERPLLRALLTGCWGDRLPAPRAAAVRSRVLAGTPAQRRADAGPPAPGELLAAVRERWRTALGRDGAGPGEEACELAVRLALSYVVAPDSRGLGALLRHTLSATSRTAEDR